MKTIFDNKQMVVNKHMDDLINMAPVFCTYDLRGLTKWRFKYRVLRLLEYYQNSMVACFHLF